MSVRITTLSENTATYGCIAEWGLSILVEADGLKILMDTGMSFSAAYNAQVLGINLSDINCIVLSHGHIDHTGGLSRILMRMNGTDVIAHNDIWDIKYACREPDEKRYIGVPFNRPEIESLGARLRLSSEPVQISDRIMTTGEIPMITSYEDIDEGLFIEKNDSLIPDTFADDLALIINADFGLVVVLGCAHRGMINTLRHAQNLTGKEQIHAVIGGTHLIRASSERIEKTITDLKYIGVQKLGVSHCTGFYASSRFAQEFQEAFFLNNAGVSFVLP
jgi:7,8-dihydropterin-6-yl-methyl-4-(beta-D-ribofuranosyl)aminobenzene 5'-phosphate synthase